MNIHDIYNPPTNKVKNYDTQLELDVTLNRIISLWWAFSWRGSIIFIVLSIFIFLTLVTLEVMFSVGLTDDVSMDIIMPIYILITPTLSSLCSVYWVLKRSYGNSRFIIVEKKSST